MKDLRSVLKSLRLIADLPQFTPPSFSLTDEEVELQHCITEIKRRLRNMGPVIADSNEALRNQFVSPILHAALSIVRITNKEIILLPQSEIVDDEYTGRVDYRVKSLEELICITESKQYFVNIGFMQNIEQCESALQTNKKKRKAGISFGDCDYLYGIVTTATDWYFILYSTEKFSSKSRNPINGKFSETALTEDSEEELELRKNVNGYWRLLLIY